MKVKFAVSYSKPTLTFYTAIPIYTHMHIHFFVKYWSLLFRSPSLVEVSQFWLKLLAQLLFSSASC